MKFKYQFFVGLINFLFMQQVKFICQSFAIRCQLDQDLIDEQLRNIDLEQCWACSSRQNNQQTPVILQNIKKTGDQQYKGSQTDNQIYKRQLNQNRQRNQVISEQNINSQEGQQTIDLVEYSEQYSEFLIQNYSFDSLIQSFLQSEVTVKPEKSSLIIQDLPEFFPSPSQIKSFNYEDEKADFSIPQQNTGLLQCLWINRFNRISIICYGTGTFITPYIVLTCGHSLINDQGKKYFTQAYFAPGHKQNFIKSQFLQTPTKSYFRMNHPSKSLADRPEPEDFAVVFLQDKYKIESQKMYLCAEKLQPSEKLTILGYPTRQYSNKKDIRKIKAKRQDLEGEYKYHKQHIIFHNCDTKTGHSGSAILREMTVTNNKNSTQSKKYVICGVHTHKGMKSFNSGIAITNQKIKWIKESVQFLYSKNSIDYNEKTCPKKIVKNRYNQFVIQNI